MRWLKLIFLSVYALLLSFFRVDVGIKNALKKKLINKASLLTAKEVSDLLII